MGNGFGGWGRTKLPDSPRPPPAAVLHGPGPGVSELCPRRCPWLSLYVSPVIPVYNAVVFLFVLANFSMATFMDPGIFPRGERGSRQGSPGAGPVPSWGGGERGLRGGTGVGESRPGRDQVAARCGKVALGSWPSRWDQVEKVA